MRDYLHIFVDRYEYDDRRVTTGSLTHWRRSDLIRILVDQADKYNDVYHFDDTLLDSYNEFEDVGGYQGRDYTGSKLNVVRVIEDLAGEDARSYSGAHVPTNPPEDLGWDFYVDDGYSGDTEGRPAFHYYPRYSIVVPITFTHGGFGSGNSVPILADYAFGEIPIEHKNLCIIRSPNLFFDVEVAAVDDLLAQNEYHAVKEMIVEDPSIDGVAAAWQRGISELNKTRVPPLRGSLNCQFYPTYIIGGQRFPLRAGHVVKVFIPEKGINEDYLVLALTYKEPPGLCNVQLIRKGAGSDEVLGATKESPLDFDKKLRDMDKEIKYVSWMLQQTP
jgi:hypothetical protein